MKKLTPFLLFIYSACAYEQAALITYYCPCEICCSVNTGITANGSKARANHTVAAPKNIPFGTIITIKGKRYVVEDRGGAIKYVKNHMKVDIYCDSHEEALRLGTFKAKVKVKLPKRG